VQKLTEYLAGFSSLAIAFSGGTDSALLAHEAIQVLGKKHVLLLHGVSVLLPECDRHFTCHFAGLGWPVQQVELEPLSIPEVRANVRERCYFCKKAMYAALLQAAGAAGFRDLADGTNADDTRDFRPGMHAAEELGILHPLLDCGLGKAAVRELARKRGLPNWDLPASACLASRIPAGTPLDEEILRRIGTAENGLSELGFRGHRVRYADFRSVRLELREPDFAKLPDCREKVLGILGKLGFSRVTADLKLRDTAQ